MVEPAFSVIIPTFNRAPVLPRAIASVLFQTFEDYELIVVDDGSTDATGDVLAGIEDPRLRRLRQEHRGVSAARNLGLAQARGNSVTFLDSDDLADPDWLAALAEPLARPEIGLATAGARAIRRRPDGSEQGEETLLPRPLGPLYRHRSLCYTAGTLAARRELLESIGGFAEPLRFAENAELAMRLVPACLDRGLEVAVVDRPLVTYHRDPAAWSTGRAAFESMRAAAEYILEHHGDRMRTLFPRGYANYRGVAAVNAARLGDVRAARRHLLAALPADPLRWTTHLRIALTFIPPLARSFWRRHGS